MLHSPVEALGHHPLDHMAESQDLQGDILFQDIVTQLLVSNHLKWVERLGSSELVQLRKSFQETCGKYKLHDPQVDVKNLEAEMRELKVEEGCREGDGEQGQVNYGELKGGKTAANMKEYERSQVWKGLHLETKLQLGDIEFDEDWLDNGECGSNSGKRRPSCGVVISRLDVKRRRNDVVDVN